MRKNSGPARSAEVPAVPEVNPGVSGDSREGSGGRGTGLTGGLQALAVYQR